MRKKQRTPVYYRVLEVKDGFVRLGVYVLVARELRSRMTGRRLGETYHLEKIREETQSPDEELLMVAFEDQLDDASKTRT